MSKSNKNTTYVPNIYSSEDNDSDYEEHKPKKRAKVNKRQKFNFIDDKKENKDDSMDDFIVEDDYIEYQDGSIKKGNVMYKSGEFKKDKSKSIDTNIDTNIDTSIFNLDVLSEKIMKLDKHIHEDKLDENVLEKYSKDEQDRMKEEYDRIKKYMNIVPTVFDILETNTSFKDKCSLMQQLDILINLDPYSYEYINKKNHLMDQVEKMKKQEISEFDDLEKELTEMVCQNESLKYRILKSKLKKEQQAVVYDKYLKLQKMEPINSEYHKLKEWIEQALNIPTDNKKINLPNLKDGNKSINKSLYNVQKLLDSKLYGMNNVKEEILLILNNKITNHDNTGNALALLGPPGTGKTCIIRTLAQALDIPFVQISLGGTTDSSYLDGHDYTYEGATPGMIAKAIMQMKCNNGIIFFDEIDKLSESDKGREVAWNLLHITDFSQNNDFRDKYLCEIPIDLSKIWFIYSMNDDRYMDKALHDRMPIIQVSGYDKTDKVNISKKYIIPNIMKNINMAQKTVNFSDSVIEYIVSLANDKNGTNEKINELSGVRELEKILGRILSRINLYKNTVLDNGKTGNLKLTYSIKNFKLPLNLTNDIVDDLLHNYKKRKSMNTCFYS